MNRVRLTRRGRIVLGIVAALVAVIVGTIFWQGYEDCLDRGYSAAACSVN